MLADLANTVVTSRENVSCPHANVMRKWRRAFPVKNRLEIGYYDNGKK